MILPTPNGGTTFGDAANSPAETRSYWTSPAYAAKLIHPGQRDTAKSRDSTTVWSRRSGDDIHHGDIQPRRRQGYTVAEPISSRTG